MTVQHPGSNPTPSISGPYRLEATCSTVFKMTVFSSFRGICLVDIATNVSMVEQSGVWVIDSPTRKSGLNAWLFVQPRGSVGAGKGNFHFSRTRLNDFVKTLYDYNF